MQRLVVVREWTGKFVINEFYRPIAEALVKKYSELSHIPVDSIIFVDNTVSKGKNKNKFKIAQIGKMPEKYHDIIYQLTGRCFDYIMEVFKHNLEDKSREQIIACVYHELRHIGRDGSIILHEIEDWDNMHYQLGYNWMSTKAMIPDLLADGVNWNTIIPHNLFLGPHLKAVK